MQTRRLLSVRPRREARLAPIYAALLSLTLVSVLGLGVAFWPEGPAPAAHRSDHDGAAPAGRSYEGGLRVPPDAAKPGSRGRWM